MLLALKFLIGLEIVAIVSLVFLRKLPLTIFDLTFKVARLLGSVLRLGQHATETVVPSILAVLVSGMVGVLLAGVVLGLLHRAREASWSSRLTLVLSYIMAVVAVVIARWLYPFHDGDRIVGFFAITSSLLMLLCSVWWLRRCQAVRSQALLIVVTLAGLASIVLIYLLPFWM